MRDFFPWVIWGVMLLLVGAFAGCTPADLGSECARICGDDWFRCSIARPDEPRSARMTQLATETSPGVDFSIKYSGVICEFVYVNHAVPVLNFNVGAAVAPETERGQNRPGRDDRKAPAEED